MQRLFFLRRSFSSERSLPLEPSTVKRSDLPGLEDDAAGVVELEEVLD